MITDINSLVSKTIHIVGLSGAEGSAIAKFLWKKGCKNLIAHDFAKKEEFDKSFRRFHLTLSSQERASELQFLKNLPIPIHYQATYLQEVENADIIFASQGWIKHAINFPRLKIAYDKGIPFATMTQLYFQFSPAPIIAVTGSNGKSTTTAIIHHILTSAGKKSFMAGNARESGQVLDTLDELTPQDFLVLEVSDRQLLADIPKAPHIAVVTTITPNHLDDHGTLEKYIEVKQRLLGKQTTQDIAILNWDNLHTTKFIACTSADSEFFTSSPTLPSNVQGSTQSNQALYIHGEELICFANIPLPGEHNRMNIQAAALACYRAGIAIPTMAQAIQTFKGLPHRLEFVGQYDGIRYFDDIQSTTPESTIVALNAFTEPVILIAGGDDKGMEYEGMAQSIVANNALTILLPGSGTDKLKMHLAKMQYSTEQVSTFVEALEKVKHQGCTAVLVSPGCAYFQSRFLEAKSIKSWVEQQVNDSSRD